MTHSFPTRRSSDLPHQAPLENRMRWRGRCDDGYDAARERWHARQLDLGVIPPGTPLAPPNPGVPAWTDLTPNQKAFSARRQEAFAAMLENTDEQLGRLVDFLEGRGLPDATVPMVLSDNGRSDERRVGKRGYSPVRSRGWRTH